MPTSIGMLENDLEYRRTTLGKVRRSGHIRLRSPTTLVKSRVMPPELAIFGDEGDDLETGLKT